MSGGNGGLPGGPDEGYMCDVLSGERLLLEIDGLDARLQSIFIGSLKDRFVLLQIPFSRDVKMEVVYRHLYENNIVSVRYLREGVVRGFHSTVITHTLSPFPVLYLRYPATSQTFRLRKDDRYSCLYPCAGSIGGRWYEGMLTDLSASGGKVMLNVPENARVRFRKGDALSLSCEFFGARQDSPIVCEIKVAADVGKCLELGVMFVSSDESVGASLKDLLAEAALYLSC